MVKGRVVVGLLIRKTVQNVNNKVLRNMGYFVAFYLSHNYWSRR